MERRAVMGSMVAAVEGGDPDEARRLAGALAALGPHPAVVFDGALPRVEAALLRAEGRVDDARARLLAAADEAAESEDRVEEAAALYDVVRSRRAGPEVVDRLAGLAGVVDGEWVVVYAAHGRGALEGDGAALAATASTFEGLGAMALAAGAARDAADAFASAGDQRASARLAVEATRLGALTETAMATAAGLGGADPLTRREREVAELAAKGLTSKVIGERLYVSTRTVESHLLRAYTKLGVRTRAELAELLAISG
jgi:DNA-binding CsgD family transcriptional regulator